MFTNRIGLAALAAACVTAAGAGGFLASHYSAAPEPTEVAGTATPGNAAAMAPPVQETEAVVEDAPAATAEPSAPAPAAAPATTPAPSRPVVEPARERDRARDAAAPVREPETRSARSTAKPAPQPEPARPALEPSTTDVTRPDPPRSAPPIEAPVETARRESLEVPPLPERRFEELVVEADSVIGLQLDRTVSSETARVEDRVDAQVTRDVRVDGRVAIPAGSKVQGAVTVVERGGKVKERARLGVRFHTLVLADGTTLQLQTDTVYREGESPSGSSATKIGGGAIGGAILGAILGGGKGAIIGGSTGAAGGTAAVMAGSRRSVSLGAGSTITVRVLSPVAVTVER